MHKNFLLAVGITTLFLGLAIAPVITAVDNDTDEVDDESMDNSDEIETSDEYKEIITYIDGNSEITWIKKRGLFRGEAEMKMGIHDWLYLRGIRRSNGGWEIYSEDFVEYIYAPHFIGWQVGDVPFIGLQTGARFGDLVRGIALGNIEWRAYEF